MVEEWGEPVFQGAIHTPDFLSLAGNDEQVNALYDGLEKKRTH
jgi:hypothetical protein